MAVERDAGSQDAEGDEGNEEVTALFRAWAEACADQDPEAWRALIHPRAIQALSGAQSIVLEYHQSEAFRRPYALEGWQVASFWEATETHDLHQFVPPPDSVARRVKAMPFGLSDGVMERMLATHEGRLRFALRAYGEDIHGYLREAIARQAERSSWAREAASRLPSEVREEVLRRRPSLEVGVARRAVVAHEHMDLRRSWDVVHAVWAEAARSGS